MDWKEEDPFQKCELLFFIEMKIFSRLVAMEMAKKKKKYRFRLFMNLKIDLFFSFAKVYLYFFLVTPKSLLGL